MTIHTVASQDFNRDVGRAKRLAAEGPVFITDRGMPTYALLRIEDYYALSGSSPEPSLLTLMEGMPGTSGIDYEAPRAEIGLKGLGCCNTAQPAFHLGHHSAGA